MASDPRRGQLFAFVLVCLSRESIHWSKFVYFLDHLLNKFDHIVDIEISVCFSSVAIGVVVVSNVDDCGR